MPLSGSQEFCEDLLNRQFPCASDEVDEMSGYDINGHELCKRGFNKPLLIGNREGLRIKVPSSSFSPMDLLSYIDPDHTVDVIDVREQEEIQMSLNDLVDHFVTEPRTRLLNMLSLEFSQTRLSDLVQPPHVVSELSLITNCWVPDSYEDDADDPSSSLNSTPSVQKYCLLSMRGSYTDFHIDFGGSSVWYHVLWGEKIFYLVPPTPENCTAYWNWSWHPDHRNIFFPDMLSEDRKSQHCDSRHHPLVYQLRVQAGQTILLPSGWIHAVYTPSDCLVFGGNFLSELHIPSQLKVYRMEQKSGTPIKFQFPNFEKVHWFAADRIVGRLTNALYDEQEIRLYEIDAVRSLAKVLPRWYERRRSLSVYERSYYLPSRATLEVPWTCLIERLLDLSRTFETTYKKSKRLVQYLQSFPLTESDSSITTLHSADTSNPAASSSSSKITVKFDSQAQSKKTSGMRKRTVVRPKSGAHKPTGATAAAAGGGGGGLGWATKHKRSEEPPSESVLSATDDPDVLNAVPELSSSRLIGDHYFLDLSDSEEDEGSAPLAKRARSSRKSRGRVRDPDPTWSASSPNAKKNILKILKGSDRPLSPTNFKTSIPTLSLSGGGLHPLLQHQASSSSVPAKQLNPAGTGSNTSASTKQSKTKASTTVRQRLAKRLGI